jgi:phenylalanyl-tRNA synthetase alpha chain
MNIPSSILNKIGLNLHNRPNHPLQIVKQLIFDYFQGYQKFDTLSPKVPVTANFDSLLIPPDHPARSKSDTYYLDDTTVLRTHTSAHQAELLSTGHRQFLVAGDVYRKDEIDRTHYPVFHQIEGVCVTESADPSAVEADLKRVLTGLVTHLFPNKESRFNPDYFPFTHPSFEVEVKFGDRWLEILGCGVIQPAILRQANCPGTGWAFGLGLERIAMLLFDLPDIRYFWVDHPKFLSQFRSGKVVKFTPYSLLAPTARDISFWIPTDQIRSDQSWSRENDFLSVIRDVSGNVVQRVELLDKFQHPKTQRYSRAYRITYEEMDPNVTDPAEFTAHVNTLQSQIVAAVATHLPELTIR